MMMMMSKQIFRVCLFLYSLFFRSHLSIKLATPMQGYLHVAYLLHLHVSLFQGLDPPAAAAAAVAPTYRTPVPSGVNLTGRRGKV